MKSEPQFYKPAEACRIAEVAPYVLRYWETEFPALSEGKEKGPARLYSSRDVKIISRIRELLYDEGFTVAGAKKRLEAEISEGRFEEGVQAPPAAARARKAAAPVQPALDIASPAFLAEPNAPRNQPESATDFPERKRVVKELREIVKLLDRHRSR